MTAAVVLAPFRRRCGVVRSIIQKQPQRSSLPQWNGVMLSFTKRAIRGLLEANGYYLRHRGAMPYGIDYMWDIKRLAVAKDLAD